MRNIRLIESKEIRRVLRPEVIVPAVERTLAAFSKGPLDKAGVVQPLRSRVPVSEENGLIIVMPGYVPSEGALATKLVTLFPNNMRKGIASHHGIVVLLKKETGQVEAILEGNSITEIRTAASSVVASKYLAPAEVNKVAVLGAGAQGSSHAAIHHSIFKPKEITIWSRTSGNSQTLVETLLKEGIPAVHCSTVEEAVLNADIINTCTLATSPVLKKSMIKSGAHINAVGAARPDWQEIEANLMTYSTVYADSKEAALVESGDVIASNTKIVGEIGDVIRGKITAARNETTIYKNLGIAALDAISARLTLDLLEKGN